MKPLINQDHFEAIKQEVLKQSDFDQIIARDCKTIADVIEEKTRCRISETTLKRLFGFAEAKYLPSAYTMDVLAKYCGHKNWSTYTSQSYKAVITPVAGGVCVQSLRQRIHHITACTLQTLKDKSGIAFCNTVPRKFMDEHMHFFLQSDLPGTILFAPPGSGKTIAMCHWANDFLAQRQQHHNSGDLLFFVSFNALSNAFFCSRDIHSWLLSMMGYTQQDEFAALLADLEAKDHRLYFVIDGLDSIIIKGDAFKLIVDQIADVLNHYRNQPAFRMVLSMRTGTLNQYCDILKTGDADNWFMGFANNTASTNVPPLNAAEIKDIAYRINPKTHHEVTIEQVRQLQHPLYLQYYYRLFRDNFSLIGVDSTTVFDQVLAFIKARVHHDGEMSERQTIVHAICNRLAFNEQKFYAVKNDIDEVLRHNKAGYHDLLSSGFITESNTWAGMDMQARVEFANEDFLCYAVARHLLRMGNDVVDEQLFANISTALTRCTWRLKVAKWFIVYAIKSEQFITPVMLNAMALTLAEKADMLAFWGDLFKKQGAGNYMQRMFELPGQEELIGYFVGKEFSEAQYHRTLQSLSTFKLSAQSKVIVHTALGMNAVLTLDLPELEKQTNVLSNLIECSDVDLPFDPVICLKALCHYLKFGILKADAAAMLAKVSFNGPGDVMAHPSYQQFYLLGIYTLRLGGKHDRVLQLIDVFDRSYADKKAEYPAYDFFASVARIDALLAIDETTAFAMYEELSKTHHSRYNEYSALMRMHFSMLKLKVMIAKRDELNIQWQMQLTLNHADQHGFKLLKARCLALMLQNSTDLHLSEDLHKKIYYDLARLNRENALNNDWFIEGAA